MAVAKVQRMVLPDGKVSYTVVGSNRLTITEAREYLRFLVEAGASPNTVKSYAYGLAAWWTVLDHTGHKFDDFPTTLFGSYLSYLRTGDLPGTTRIGTPDESRGMAAASLQPRGAAVLSMYKYFADAHDLLTPYRRLFSSHARAARRNPYAGFLTGIGPRRQHEQPIYRRRSPNRTETPVLLPQQVITILDSCSTQQSGTWTGSAAGLRDRLFFAVLAETGMRMGEALSLRHHDFHISGGGTPYVHIVDRGDHPHGMRAKSGGRRIFIGDDLVGIYSEFVWQLVAQGADVVVDDLSTHFVFVNLVRGEKYAAMRPETVYDKVDAIKATHSDLPAEWTPHWFRHTHATALLLSGAPPHVVMRRLGHADVQTTLSIYGWVTEDAEMRSVGQWKSYVAGWKGLHEQHQ
ncbi:tyrosine-type recombinase/integrase [Gordonia otitidis]|uniref:tyrosine-type recombinase/integrase n=1 Tax=Gordonia otitidis TaxID=249058 RepID=UPI00235435D9|nr:tyrosine-type recombinase/integrase [Gordonia otitidis]